MPNLKRTRYDLNFKQEAVSLVEQEGYSMSEGGKRFGVSKTTMALWVKQYGHASNNKTKVNGSSMSLFEQKQLQKELTNVRRERDILKKALAYFVANPQQ